MHFRPRDPGARNRDPEITRPFEISFGLRITVESALLNRHNGPRHVQSSDGDRGLVGAKVGQRFISAANSWPQDPGTRILEPGKVPVEMNLNPTHGDHPAAEKFTHKVRHLLQAGRSQTPWAPDRLSRLHRRFAPICTFAPLHALVPSLARLPAGQLAR